MYMKSAKFVLWQFTTAVMRKNAEVMERH